MADEQAAPQVDTNVVSVPDASEAQAPAAAPKDAMAAFEQEYGNAATPGSQTDEGAEGDKPKEPGVSEEDEGDDLEVRLSRAEQRAKDAEDRLAAATAKGKEPPKDDAAPVSTQPSDPAPKPEDFEYGAADDKYIAELSRWNARQEFAQMRAKEALTAELDTIEHGWKEATGNEEFKAEYPDFDEVVTKGAAEEKWECTPLMALAIKSSPVGGHVAYELASNPAEASRIAKLIPVEQAYELGKLEGRVGTTRSNKTAPQPKVASSAPPPPANRARGSGGQYVNELSSVQDRMLKEFR